MLYIKMFNILRKSLIRISNYLNDNKSISSKNYRTKAEIIKQLRKDDKEMFGSLLETRKQKMAREKNSSVKVPVVECNLDNNKHNGHINDKGESLWTIEVANPDRLSVIKKKSQLQMTKITKSSQKDCIGTIIPNKKNICTVTDKINVPENNEKIKLDNIIACVKNAPLIHTEKCDIDKWNSTTILSLLPNNHKHNSLPGVTKILNESMSDEAKLLLENWKKRMILQLGVAGFQIYQKELLENSKLMHSLIEKTLKKESIDIPNHLQSAYNSINSILKDITNVRFIESHVSHPTLGYRGFIDCIACYKGNLCVIDWKKSDKLKTLDTIYDSPLQVSAYIGALNSDENYSFKVKMGLLTIAYTHGHPASVFELKGDRLEFYWQEWLKRLEKYYASRDS